MALTLAFGVQAILSGNNLLFLQFTVMTGFIIVLAGATWLAPHRISARRILPEEGCAGSEFSYQLEVRNPRNFTRAAWLQVQDHCAGTAEVPPLLLGRLAPGASAGVPQTLVAPKRGWLVFDRVRIVCRFPFGLFEAERWLANEDLVLVLPQRWVLSRQFCLAGLDEGSLSPLVQPSFSAERADFSGLREFHPGDHPRQIHWHASGRVPGQILARQFEPPRDRQLFIFVDSFYRQDQAVRTAVAFEDNICLALALAERLLASQFVVTVVAWSGGCRRFTLNSSAAQLHDLRRWLAVLEPTHDHGLTELLAAALLPSNASVIVLALSRETARRATEKSRWLAFTPDQLKPFAVRPAMAQSHTPLAAPIV